MDKVYFFYSIERWFYVHHMTALAILVRIFMRISFSCDIPYHAKIGRGTTFPHDALSVVIHQGAVIGKNCKILHGVTIGGRGGKGRVGLPEIGNNVLIGCHAQIMGPIVIGDNATIGACSVVVKDVPANCTVVGNPAKIISQE